MPHGILEGRQHCPLSHMIYQDPRLSNDVPKDLSLPAFSHDVPNICLCVLDIDIVQLRMHAQPKVGGEGPGGGRPRNQRDGWVCTNHGESGDTLGIAHVLRKKFTFRFLAPTTREAAISCLRARRLALSFLPRSLHRFPSWGEGVCFYLVILTGLEV